MRFSIFKRDRTAKAAPANEGIVVQRNPRFIPIGGALTTIYTVTANADGTVTATASDGTQKIYQSHQVEYDD